MKTAATFGVICAAIFVVMSTIAINAIVPADAASPARALGPAPVNLGTSGDFVILAKSGISTTGTTLITGDIGVSPIDHTGITGFSETMDSSNQFSISAYVVGKLFAADYTDPTPAKMTTAVSDMETAYTDAAGRTLPNATELGAGDISAMTLVPGLYKWGTGVHIDNRGVTLSGGADDVWIFQIAQDLTVDSAAIVTLSGGAQVSNIFWQVGGGTGVTLGTTSVFNGNILAIKAIVLNTGATLNGRALAQTAVTLDANSVTAPSSSGPSAPVSTVNPIGPYWKNTSPQTITASGSANSKSIELFYRYSADNATWSAWTSFGNDTAFPWSWSFTFPSGGGYYQFYSRAYENSSNFEAAPGAADRFCGYDNIAPNSSVDAQTPYWRITGPLTITATATDATTGVGNVTLFSRYAADNATWGAWIVFGTGTASPWNWSFTFPDGNGYYEFYTIATDGVGNSEAAPAAADMACGYDNEAPTSACDAAGAYWRNAAVTITATASDAMSGVGAVELFYRNGTVNGTFGPWTSAGVDDASPWSWTYAFASGQGFYEFYTMATDRAGNIEAAPAAADIRYAYDNDKPVIGADPTPNAVTAGGTLMFNITIPDAAGVVSVQVSLDNTTFVNCTGPGTWKANLTLANGSNMIYIRAADAAGNIGYSSRQVYLDAVAPNVTISSPANGTVLTVSTVMVAGTATDNVLVSKIEASTNGGTTWTVANGTTAWTVNLTLGAGTNTILVRATDTAGNTRSAQLTLSVDTQSPTVSISLPAPGAKVDKARLKVSGTSSDNMGVARVQMTVNGVAVTVNGLNAWSANVTLKEGKNIIIVTATDGSGLTSSKNITVTYTKPKQQPGFEGIVLVGAVIVGLLVMDRRKRL
jgi:hypothetical protein